jgi:leader peptidase (prepilin peptidase) / N-methyltransferase
MMLAILISNFLISFLFLCWGSFLNVVAYRLLHNTSFWQPRSRCVSCYKIIAWYDLIPLISWIFLHGRCRHCNRTISGLYFLIELLTLISFWGIIIVTEPPYWLSYGLLFSVLLITIRTDLESFIILRPFSLGLIPFGLILSALGYLPITILESLLGIIIGYGFLWIIATLYFLFTHKIGMGEGDPELLAGIGAFVGPWSCWYVITIGALLGSLTGIFFIWRYGAVARNYPLPFGPFLALGTFVVILFL